MATPNVTFGSLFSGIGGLDLGLETAGMKCAWQVEIDQYCLSVLKTHWPQVRKYEDIKTVTGFELESVDCIAGGFPCQDLSLSGFRRGIAEDTRSGLWSEFARIIGVLRPRLVLIENVPGLLANEPMRRVLGDLSSLGMDAEWECVPAASVGAPHLRDRVWILAYSRQKLGFDDKKLNGIRRCPSVFRQADDRISPFGGKDWKLAPLVPGIHPRSAADWWLRQSKVARSTNGIPRQLADAANGAFGNAVVPQVAEWIGRRIMKYLTVEHD